MTIDVSKFLVWFNDLFQIIIDMVQRAYHELYDEEDAIDMYDDYKHDPEDWNEAD